MESYGVLIAPRWCHRRLRNRFCAVIASVWVARPGRIDGYRTSADDFC